MGVSHPSLVLWSLLGMGCCRGLYGVSLRSVMLYVALGILEAVQRGTGDCRLVGDSQRQHSCELEN